MRRTPKAAPALPLAVLVVLLALAGLSPPALADAKEEYLHAVQTIRCDCGCHPQSLGDCACGYAANLREEIAAMIEAPDGSIKMTGKAVVAKFIAEKGEQILISPRASGFNLIAWLGPLIGLGGALLVSFFVIRNMGRRSTGLQPLPASPIPSAETAEGDDAYREKLRRQLAEWD